MSKRTRANTEPAVNPEQFTGESLRILRAIMLSSPRFSRIYKDRLEGLSMKPPFDPFGVLAGKGEDYLKRRLKRLTRPELFSIIYFHNLDPHALDILETRKGVLVDHVLEQIGAARSFYRVLSDMK